MGVDSIGVQTENVSKAQMSSRVLSLPTVGFEQRTSVGDHSGLTMTKHLAISVYV